MEKVHLGGGGLGRKDTRVCMTESLCYSLGTAALLIGCTPIQSALVLKKKTTCELRVEGPIWLAIPRRERPGCCLCHRGGHRGVGAHLPVCTQPGERGNPGASPVRGFRFGPALRPHLSL